MVPICVSQVTITSQRRRRAGCLDIESKGVGRVEALFGWAGIIGSPGNQCCARNTPVCPRPRVRGCLSGEPIIKQPLDHAPPCRVRSRVLPLEIANGLPLQLNTKSQSKPYCSQNCDQAMPFSSPRQNESRHSSRATSKNPPHSANKPNKCQAPFVFAPTQTGKAPSQWVSRPATIARHPLPLL